MQPDYSKLDPKTIELIKQTEANSPANKQLTKLSDIEQVAQEIVFTAEDIHGTQKENAQKFGALLMDVRDSLTTIRDKPEMEMPDHKPVVDALDKLDVNLSKAISKIELNPTFNPNINVDSPSVNVAAPDLKGIEKLFKDLPKAFDKAIKSIEMPEMADNSGVIDLLKEMSDKLSSVDTATRLKSQMATKMQVTNPDGTNVGNTALTNTQLRATPVDVSSNNRDIFGYQVIVQPYNQIELRGDDSDWASYVTETNVNGGNTVQSSGLLSITTSTAATGSAILNSVDQVNYRPGVGVYGAGTMIFTTGVAGSVQYFGLSTTTTMDNGVLFGYQGASFGIRYMRGGSEISFTAQASWDDPCLGGAASKFTRSGVAEALDPTHPNLYRIEAGLFGFAGWRAQVWSPDNGWITVLTYEHINTASPVPVFTSNTFYMLAVNTKTSGATDITMLTQCWGAGTGTPMMRIGSTTLSDRTLAQTTRAVIAGRSTAGGTSYVNVKVSPSGAVQVGGTLDTVTSLPLPSGAATSAAQTTAQTTLTSIDTNIALKNAPGKLRYTNIISASTSIIPTAGKAIKVIKVQVVPSSDNAGAVQMYLHFATSSIDVFKGYAGGGYGVFTGAVNEILTITQTGAGNVQVLVDYNEV